MTQLDVNLVEQLDDQARAILKANDRGGYTVPTDGLYPYQWNWDSAFAAFGFARFDLERAWLELETLFSGQWETGMVPHILFHEVDEGYFPGPDVWGCGRDLPSSGISQPPVAATFARKLFEQDPASGRDRIDDLFDRMIAWHRWFMEARAESGAIAITHPWESGRDNAFDWDKAMAAVDASQVKPYTRRDTTHVDASMRPTKFDYDRYIALVEFGRASDWNEAVIRDKSPFRMADPTMTFTLLRAHRDLLWLAEQTGRRGVEIEDWISGLEAGLGVLWNEAGGHFDALDLRTGRHSGSLSNASFLCWYGGVNEPRMQEHLDRALAGPSFGIASLSLQSPQFDPKRYWRGPVWGIMNTLIGMGLEEQGLTEQAGTLRRQTADLLAQHGFAEYYNPLDGTPAGGGTFTWTAAIWLSWASPSAGGR